MATKTPNPKLKKEIQEIKLTLDTEKAALTRIKNAKIRGLEILQKGYDISGYESEAVLGNRAWTKKIDAAIIFITFKKWISKKSDVETNPTLKSPSAIQKYFDDVPEARDLLAKLVERKDGGFKIVAVK